MKTIKTDIIVIGGGSGGLSVASGAAQMGANVVLFEDGEMGGDCLNTGCVPSKALLAAGKAAHHVAGNSEMGIEGELESQALNLCHLYSIPLHHDSLLPLRHSAVALATWHCKIRSMQHIGAFA